MEEDEKVCVTGAKVSSSFIVLSKNAREKALKIHK